MFTISSGNKLDDMYGILLSEHNSLTSLDDKAEDFLLNFPMYVQIAIYLAIQNCMQNTVGLQN